MYFLFPALLALALPTFESNMKWNYFYAGALLATLCSSGFLIFDNKEGRRLVGMPRTIIYTTLFCSLPTLAIYICNAIKNSWNYARIQ